MGTRKNPAIGSREVLDQDNKHFTRSLHLRKTASLPDFAKTNIEKVKERSEENTKMNELMGKKKVRETPFLDGQPVYMYSSQTLNCTEKQKEWMRKHMDQEKGKMWTYGADFLSQSFEFSGADLPGVPRSHPKCPNDSYANLEGDSRPPWRGIVHPRPKEEYRKPDRDLGPARPQELREAFVEGEWQNLAVDTGRRQPVSAKVRFEPDKIPHHRRVTTRPFDPTKIITKGKEFGPKEGFESVHASGRNPGEPIFGYGTKEIENRDGYKSSRSPVGAEREQKRTFRAPDGAKTMIKSVSLPALDKTRSGSEALTDWRRIPDHTRYPKPHATTFDKTREQKFAASLTKGEGHQQGRPHDFLTWSSPPLKEFTEDEQMPRRATTRLKPEVHFVLHT
jgi:hypothetical protein